MLKPIPLTRCRRELKHCYVLAALMKKVLFAVTVTIAMPTKKDNKKPEKNSIPRIPQSMGAVIPVKLVTAINEPITAADFLLPKIIGAR